MDVYLTTILRKGNDKLKLHDINITIHTLKCMIHELLGYDVDRVCLFLEKGDKLENDKKISDCGIKNNDLILICGTTTCDPNVNKTYIETGFKITRKNTNKSYDEIIKDWGKKLLNIYKLQTEEIYKIIHDKPFLITKLSKMFKEIDPYLKEVSEQGIHVDEKYFIRTICYAIEINKTSLKLSKNELHLTYLNKDDFEFIDSIINSSVRYQYKYNEIVSLYLMIDKNKGTFMELIEMI